MSVDELRALGRTTTTDLATASRAFGYSRSTGYALARTGAFPCPVIELPTSGQRKRYRVPVAGLLRVLCLDGEGNG